MTTQTSDAVHVVELPAPGYPMLTRMICDNFFFDKKSEILQITWAIGQPHPLVPSAQVVRMFIDQGGVEIYSVSGDKRTGMRNLVPMHRVRLTEEAMPLDIFIEELTAAESEDPDPEAEEPEEPEEPETVVTNGQQAPS